MPDGGVMAWPRVALGEVLIRRELDIMVEPQREYRFAGVQSFGRGVFRGSEKRGSEFSYPRLTTVRAGDVIFPKLMAWEGAIGVVPPACDGLVVSPEFPVFGVDASRALPRFLDLIFRNESFWPLLSGPSAGTNVRRRRLHPEDFLRISIHLPLIDEQRQILARVEELCEKVDEALQLRESVSVDSIELARCLLSTSPCEPTALREVLRQRFDEVMVERDALYSFAGVYSFGRGVFRGMTRKGCEFAYPKLSRLHAGDLVYPKLMAWEGAFGIVSAECDGCVVSPEFQVFELIEDRVLPEVVESYLQTPSTWSKIAGASTGTNVRRQRLSPDAFLDHLMPVPSRDVQLRIQRVVHAVRVQMENRSDFVEEMTQIRSSLIERAIRGEL